MAPAGPLRVDALLQGVSCLVLGCGMSITLWLFWGLSGDAPPLSGPALRSVRVAGLGRGGGGVTCAIDTVTTDAQRPSHSLGGVREWSVSFQAGGDGARATAEPSARAAFVVSCSTCAFNCSHGQESNSPLQCQVLVHDQTDRRTFVGSNATPFNLGVSNRATPVFAGDFQLQFHDDQLFHVAGTVIMTGPKCLRCSQCAIRGVPSTKTGSLVFSALSRLCFALVLLGTPICLAAGLYLVRHSVPTRERTGGEQSVLDSGSQRLHDQCEGSAAVDAEAQCGGGRGTWERDSDAYRNFRCDVPVHLFKQAKGL